MKKIFIVLISILIICSSGYAGKLPWWNKAWHYRSIYKVNMDEAKKVVRVELNFNILLNTADSYEQFDINSIRVIEYNPRKNSFKEIPYKFDKKDNFDPLNNANGFLVWNVDRDGDDTEKIFHIYFDDKSKETKKPVSYNVSVPSLNMISNPGFEEESDERPDDWRWSFGAGYFTAVGDNNVVIDPAVFHSGKKSIKIVTTKEGMSGTVEPSEPIRVIPGKIYKLSFWVKTGNNPGLSYLVNYCGLTEDMKNIGKLGPDIAQREKSNMNWTCVEKVITIPKNVYYLQITFYNTYKNIATTWYDDVSLEPVGSIDKITQAEGQS